MKKSKLIAIEMRACDSCPKSTESLLQARTKESREQMEKICLGCKHFERMRELGNSVKDQNDQMEKLLRKGENMTTKEAFYLVENGVHVKRIEKALNLKAGELKEFKKKLEKGFSRAAGL